MERLVQSYSIRDIRTKIFNKLSLKNRNDIANYISIKNLYSELQIDEYLIEPELNDCFINVIDFVKLITFINLKHNSNIRLTDFKSYEKKHNSFIKINNIDEALYFDLTFNYIFSRPNLNSTINNIFKKDIKIGKTVVSFDFSFNQCYDIVDLGISYYNGKIRKDYHYLVKENLPNKFSDNSNYLSFHFGKTEIKSYDKLINILSAFIQQADIILLHDTSNDLKALHKVNLDILLENKKVIDTSLIFKIEDNHLIVKDTSKRTSLKDLLKFSNIPYSKLHNSGNDATYTLKLFIKNFNKIKKYSKVFSN